MIYDASDAKYNDTVSVSIPGIDKMLLIGNTQSILEFSTSLNQIVNFDNIYLSKDVEGAVKLLKSVKVSVVIVDGDSDFDPVSCSRLVRIQNSLVRIILISTDLQSSIILQMKNNGIFHGFISLPCEMMMAHTIIVQEQAKFHINRTLQLLLQEPPSGTTLYRKLRQSPLARVKREQDTQFSIIAVSIVHETLSLYNYVIEKDFDLDPVLFSSYFSAISIFSERIINQPGSVESFEFNKQVVFVKNIDEIQYIFILRDVTKDNRNAAESLVSTIAQKINLVFGNKIKSTTQIDNDMEMEKVIQNFLPDHQKRSFLEADKKAQIINIHEPNPNLAAFFDETSRAYEVHYVDNEDQLFDMINDANYDIVILNEFENNFKWNKYLLNIIKDESPFTQSIAIVKDTEKSNLSNILNVNDLDLVIAENYHKEQYYNIFKKAVERSKSIQEGLIISDLNQIYRLKNQPELLKAMLRREDSDEVKQPNFYLLFIFIDNEKYYSYYAKEEDNVIAVNEKLFLGFLDSLLTFTDELKNSPLMFSGIKYGKSNIIVQRKFKYHFVYFIGDLDRNNFDDVNKILNDFSFDISEVIRYDVDPYVLSDGLGPVIDEICSNINDEFQKLDN